MNYDDETIEAYINSKTSLIKWGIIGVILFIFTYIFCISWISPGEVGIAVNTLGSDKGVEDKELTVGIHFTAPWKSIYKFPIYEQNHQWSGSDAFSFQTTEGLSVKADIGINFHLEPTHIHQLFYRYRRGMDEITHLFIKNNIRNSINRVASKMRIEDLIGPKKDEFFDLVQKTVSEELKPIGFVISHVFLIGKFEIPELVMEALNKKIEATQRAQQRENELREAEAQAKKEIALAEGRGKSHVISAKAKAEANNVLAASITSDLIKWEALTKLGDALNKWDGKLPSAISGESASFLMDLRK